MLLAVKELVVVLIIAAALFRVARPLALRFSSAADYSRRRLAWYTVTAAAFLCPNFWLFAAIAIPVLISAGRRDSSPAALYLLLLNALPPIAVRIPMIGISFLFDVNWPLLLAFCVATPAVIRLRHEQREERVWSLQAADFWLLGYLALTSVLFLHVEIAKGVLMSASATDCLRRAFVAFFFAFIPYLLISRTAMQRRALLELLAAFCLGCAVLAAIAVFESTRHWLLYDEMPDRWIGGVRITSYLMRASSLRAMASAGHSLSLGYLLAIALGFWLYLRSHLPSGGWRIGGSLLLAAGLVVTYARGPWMGALAIYLAYAALGPRPFSRLAKTLCSAAAVAVCILASPLGERFVRVLPFLGGKVDEQTIIYRQRLLSRGWQIIQQNPWFGSQEALLKMEDLRQGEGIIDLMNGYIAVLLGNGFVGLFVFLCIIFIGLMKSWNASRSVVNVDQDLHFLGASLISCILGSLLMMAVGGSNELMIWILVALAIGYAQTVKSSRRATAGTTVYKADYGSPESNAT